MKEKMFSKFYQIKNAIEMRVAGVKEPGDHLLEVLGVIIIAVIILIFFRGQIVNMFNSAMTNTTQEVNNLFNPVSGTNP